MEGGQGLDGTGQSRDRGILSKIWNVNFLESSLKVIYLIQLLWDLNNLSL